MMLSFLIRREKERQSVLSLPGPADIDSDVLDLDDNFTPSSLYAGTGGKPPLAFSISDTKPQRKRSVICVLRSSNEISQECDYATRHS